MSKALVSELLKRLDWEIRTNRLLAELNNYLNLKDSLRTVLKHLREITDCEALGIRLYDGKNYPYYAYEGLEGVYVIKEPDLCFFKPTLQTIRFPNNKTWQVGCLCREVMEGKVDQDLPFFTARGSFWANNISSFLSSPNPNCLYYGYDSVALIPIKDDKNCIGLIKLLSNRTYFNLELVHYLEMIGVHISQAVLNSLAYSRMQQACESLQKLTPICSHCKNINTCDDNWQSIENYLYEHAGVEFTHTICPDCMDKLYPEIAVKIKAKDHQSAS